jgi:hypothetical protein
MAHKKKGVEMERMNHPVDLLGRVGDVDVVYWHAGGMVNVQARRKEVIVGKVISAPETYFYGLFSKKAAELADDLSHLRWLACPSFPRNVNVEGEWEERLFLSENGLVMVFSGEEQMLLRLDQKRIVELERGLMGWISLFTAEFQRDLETSAVLEGGPAGLSFP